MAKKTEKVEKVERIYIIPLREKCRPVPRYRKAEKAIKTIKEFIARHMKIRDRDLNKIKIDGYLNEIIWLRGIRNPPHKIKVKAIKQKAEPLDKSSKSQAKEEYIVRVEAVDLPEKLKFKKLREEKAIKAATEVVKKKKAEKKVEEKKTEETRPSEAELKEKVEEGEKKEEEKEKKAAVVESGKELEKAAAKKIKHELKSKEPKHQRRMALQK